MMARVLPEARFGRPSCAAVASSDSFTEDPGMARGTGRLLRFLLRATIVCAVLVGLLWLFRVPLFGGLLKDVIVDRLHEELGGRYEIDEIGGSWLTELRVRGLRTTESPPTGPLTTLGATELAIRYSPLRLIRGDVRQALESVRLSGGEVGLDLTREAAPRAADAPPSEMPWSELLSWRGELDLETDVIAQSDGGPLRVTGLTVVRTEGPLRVDVRDVDLPDRFSVQGPLAGQIARLDGERWRWTSSSRIKDIGIPEITVERRGAFEGRIDIGTNTLELRGDRAGVEAQARGFALAEVPAWMRAIQGVDGYLPTSGTLDARVSSRWEALSEPALVFEARALKLAGRPPIEVRGEILRQSDGVIHVATLTAQAEDASLRLVDTLLDSAAPYLVVRAREIRADVARLQDVVPELGYEGSIRIEAQAPDGRAVQILQARAERADGWIDATGILRLAERPTEWRRSTFEVQGSAEVEVPASLHTELAGLWRATFSGSGPLEAAQFEADAQPLSARAFGLPELTVQLGTTLNWPDATVRANLLSRVGEVRISGPVTLAGTPTGDLVYSIRVDDLAALRASALPDAPAFSGSLSAQGEVRGTRTVPAITMKLDVSALAYEGRRLQRLSADLTYEGSAIELRALSVRGDAGHADAAGRLDLDGRQASLTSLSGGDGSTTFALETPLNLRWDEEQLEATELEVRVGELRAQGALTARLDGSSATLERFDVSSPELRAALTAPLLIQRTGDQLKAVDLRVQLDDDKHVAAAFDLNVAERMARIRTLEVRTPEGDLRLDAPMDLVLDEEALRVRGLALRVPGRGQVAADGVLLWKTSRATITRLSAMLGEETLTLNAPASLAWSDTGMQATNLDVGVRGGRVRGTVAWDGQLTADVHAEDISLNGLVDGLQGQADVRAQVRGDAAGLDVHSPALCFAQPGQPMWCGPLHLKVRQVPGQGLKVERLTWREENRFALQASGALPWTWSPAGLSAQRRTSAKLDLELTMPRAPGLGRSASGPLRLALRGDAQGLLADLQAQGLAWGGAEGPREDATLRMRMTPTTAEGEVRVVGSETARVAGSFRLDRGLDWTDPATWNGFWTAARIDGSLKADVQDWAAVRQLAPSLRTLEGAARLRVRASGPLRHPKLDARLELDDFRVRVQGDLPSFDAVSARLQWRDERIVIESLEGKLGHAPFRLAGGADVPWEGLPKLDVRLTGKNLLLSRSRFLRLRSDVELRLAGVLDALRLSGSARLTNALYTQPLSLEGGTGGDGKLQLFSIRDWPFNQMSFDLEVDSDRTVRIQNNVLAARIGIKARLVGTGETPEPVGRIYFRDARVKLPLSTLNGVQGELTFTRADPMHPTLRATARARVKSYDLDVRAWGVLPDLELSVYSRPQVSPEDAILLLTTGTTRDALRVEGITGSSLQSIVSVFGGAAIAPLGSPGDPDRPSFFDRFDVTVGRYTSRAGRSTIEAEFEVSKRFFLRGERDRFDETNIGLVWRVRFR